MRRYFVMIDEKKTENIHICAYSHRFNAFETLKLNIEYLILIVIEMNAFVSIENRLVLR